MLVRGFTARVLNRTRRSGGARSAAHGDRTRRRDNLCGSPVRHSPARGGEPASGIMVVVIIPVTTLASTRVVAALLASFITLGCAGALPFRAISCRKGSSRGLGAEVPDVRRELPVGSNLLENGDVAPGQVARLLALERHLCTNNGSGNIWPERLHVEDDDAQPLRLSGLLRPVPLDVLAAGSHVCSWRNEDGILRIEVAHS